MVCTENVVLTNRKLQQYEVFGETKMLQNALNKHMLLPLKHGSALPDVVFPLS